MRGRSWTIAEVLAHLLNGLVVEPALPNALVDSPAVCPQLAGTDIVMSALMVEHEEAHGVRLLVEQIRIQNDDTWWCRARSRQPRIENVAHATAPEYPVGDQQFSIPPQSDGRRQARQVAVAAHQLAPGADRRRRREAAEAHH